MSINNVTLDELEEANEIPSKVFEVILLILKL